MKMIWSGWKIKENCYVLVNQFHGNIHSKTPSYRKIKSVFRDLKWCFDQLMHREDLKGLVIILWILHLIISCQLVIINIIITQSINHYRWSFAVFSCQYYRYKIVTGDWSLCSGSITCHFYTVNLFRTRVPIQNEDFELSPICWCEAVSIVRV